MTRTLLTVAVLAAIALAWLGMRRGWQRIGIASAHVPAPQEEIGGDVIAGPWQGRYLGATRPGDWLQRVSAHTLGNPSALVCTLTTEGLRVERPGARSFGVPTRALVGVRADRAIAGRAYEDGGIIVVTARFGDADIDFGMRLPSTHDHLAALAAITQASGATA